MLDAPTQPKSPFEIALAFVLEREGGAVITNDPHDPGGLTKWGISKRAHPEVDIQALTREGAAAIYRSDYWLPTGCEELPPAVAVVLFDSAVNQGASTAVKLLQFSVGVNPDGVVGPKTLRAVQTIGTRYVVREFLARRLHRYMQTKGFDVFGPGWIKRVLLAHEASIGVAA